MRIDYTDIARTYDDYRSYPRSLIEEVVSFGTIRDGMRLLDLGCGTGNVAAGLREIVRAQVIGVDISLPMLAVAREKSLDVLRADCDRGLPFRDSSFDGLVGGYIVHQISNRGSLFSECHRVLGKGALVLMTSSHRQIDSQHPVLAEFFPSCVEIDKVRFPDIPEVVRLLDAAGFDGIEHREVLARRALLDAEYLRRVKARHVSTFRLLPQDEFDLGVRKLEAFIRSQGRPQVREWRCTLVRARKNALA